jgi:hypothetical protein
MRRGDSADYFCHAEYFNIPGTGEKLTIGNFPGVR